MNVAFYLRVSTQEQSVEIQRADLAREALRRGWSVVETYEEKVSGASENRPQLRRLLEELPRKRFGAVMVWRVDRLGRKMLQLANVLGELEGHGVALIALREGIDTTTPLGRAFFHFAGIFAEIERDAISERTRAGIATARRKGKALGRPRKTPEPERLRYALQLYGGDRKRAARNLGVSLSTLKRALRVKNPGGSPGDPPHQGTGT